MKSPSVQSNPSNPYLSLPGVVQDGTRFVCWVLIGMKMMVETTHGAVVVESHFLTAEPAYMRRASNHF
jgi:hypothetical protein